MAKMLDGHGDMLIYGFESAPGSDRLYPWLLGNLGILRQYIHDGGHYQEITNKDGTTGAYFHLDDMPLGFLETVTEYHPLTVRTRGSDALNKIYRYSSPI